MKRLVIRWRDAYSNLPVTHIERDEGIVYAYQGETLVGIFDIGSVDALYLSGGDKD